MKKLCLSLLTAFLLIIVFTACSEPPSPARVAPTLPMSDDALHLLTHEDGQYVYLGMTRESIEQIFYQYRTYTLFGEPNDTAEGGTFGIPLEGLSVFFDEHNRVSVVSVIVNDRYWSLPNGIQVGATIDEINAVFNEKYVRNFVTTATIGFTSDHVPLAPDQINTYSSYRIIFSIDDDSIVRSVLISSNIYDSE